MGGRKFRNLNIGCGQLDFPDCLNVDIRKTPIVHMIVDLESFPYPFKDEQFESIYAFDVIEHFDNVIRAMEELHRVLKPDGLLFIRTSNWRTENSFCDPTHRHFFTSKSFDFFDPSSWFGQKYGYYTDKKFQVLERGEDGQERVFVLQKIGI